MDIHLRLDVTHNNQPQQHRIYETIDGWRSYGPDGQMATIIHQPDGKFLNIYDIDTQQSTAFINVEQYADDEANLGQPLWIDNRHFAVEFVLVKEGIESLISTKQSRNITIIDIMKHLQTSQLSKVSVPRISLTAFRIRQMSYWSQSPSLFQTL